MTDTSSFDPNGAPDTTIDDDLMPGTRAPSAPLYPYPSTRTGEPGETGGFTPQQDKVFSPELFDQRRKERLAITSEGMAREVMGDDANKWQKAARLARKYNLDPSLVTPNLTDYEVKDLAERFGAASPKVRNFLTGDKVNALLGYDDIENLNKIESGLGSIWDIAKGFPEQFGGTIGSALQGFGATVETASPELRPFLRELATLDRSDAAAVAELRARADKTLLGKDRFSFHSAMSDVLEGADTGQKLLTQMAPPVTSTWGYRTGVDVTKASDLFPLKPGEQPSILRQLGGGLGSMSAGIAVSALTGPIGAGTMFTLSGAGEAAQRAVDEMQNSGMSDDDIVRAARLGYVPGLTDSLPIETLLGRLPIPGGKFIKVPAGMLGSALKGVGRIGWQAFIEGVQEGGQQYLQNLIAREVYKPDQSLTEGLPGDAGIGAGVGGIAQVVKEGIGLLGGRRRGPTHLIRDAVRETDQAQVADQTAAGLADAMQRVQSSPLTERDPERMKALISDIAGENGSIYMPAAEVTRLYQDGIVTDQTFAEWGVLDQMMEVRATGGDLIIPAANFLTSTVAKEAIPEIARSVRTSAASMTAREAEAFRAERDARIEAFLTQIDAQAEQQPDGAFVYEQVRKALADAGVAAGDAKSYAAVTADRYQRRAADREGVTADALFVRDNFQILGPGLEQEVRSIVKDEMDVVIARLLSGREVKTPKSPVLDILKKRGGVDPQSPLGQDLAAMGLTAKSNPGLFKATGLKAADNIVASEEPVLTDNGIATDPNGYAQQDALMEAIREEIAGRPWQTQDEKDRIARLDAPVEELRRIMDKAGFDYRNASPSAIRAFLETQSQDPPVIEGETEAAFDQAFRPRAFVEFGRKIADVLAGKLRVSEVLRLGHTPRALQLAGAPDAPLVMPASVVMKARRVGKHQAPVNVLELLPDYLQRPVAVFDSGTDGGIVSLIDALDDKGFPIVAAVHFDSGKPVVNRIASVHGRDRMAWVPEQVSLGRLRYLDKDLSQRWSARTGIQLPGGDHLRGTAATGSKQKIFTEADLVKGGKTVLDQPDGSMMGKRGDFTRVRSPYGDIANIIRLTRNANRSTFLHESGHFWYHQLVEDAFSADPLMKPEARERLQADLQSVLKWFGLDLDVKTSSAEEVFAATTTEMHEKFARGAEAYFFEGKAPSLEQRKMFAKFSGWLISIYRKLKFLNVELNDEVRGVFDRLLATEEAIQEAADKRMYAVPAELAKALNPAEKAQIEKLAEEAKTEARMQLQGRVAKEILREKTEAWKKEKERVREELTLSVRRRPVYAAINLMRDAVNAEGAAITNEDGSLRSFKLNRKEMTDRYGEEIVSLLPSGVWARNGNPSISIDTMASLAGFDSADALKLALMRAKEVPERDVIRQEVDAEMKKRHGDLMDEVEQEASDAIANDKQLELMALQARLLKRMARDAMRDIAERQGAQKGAAPLAMVREGVANAAQVTDAVERSGAPAEAALGAQMAEEFARSVGPAQKMQRVAQAAAQSTVVRMRPDADQVGIIKEAAKEFVRRRKIRDLGTPEMYERQAARQTREIEKLIAGRKYPEAAILMEQRLFNAQMAREVREAQATVEKVRTYLDKFGSKKKREAIGKAGEDYLEQIDALLEIYEFRSASNAFLDRKQTLADWLKEQEAAGNVVPDVPDRVMRRLEKTNYRQVSYGELLDLRDAVKSIEHVARNKNKLMREAEKRAMEELEAEAVATIEGNLPPLPPVINPQRDGFKSNWRPTVAGYLALVTKAQTYFAKMDGKEGDGFFFRTILAPLRQAQVAKLKRLEAEGEKFRAIVQRHYGKSPNWTANSSKVFIPEIGASLTLDERLSIALNWGNEDNRQALLNDKSEARKDWGPAGYQAILDTLTKRDWNFVQATWDYINDFWPEIAALQKKRTGLAPPKVEASPVETKFGAYRGGYYPLKYDARMQAKTKEASINDEFASMNAGRFAAASTKRGHTKGRTGSGGQSPMLATDLISRHVAQVVTDLEVGPAISDAWKILQREKIKNAIQRHMGLEVVDQLDVWIKDTAVGQIQAADQMSRALRGLRTSVSAGAMGLKVATTLMQVSGFAQTAVQVGKRETLLSLTTYAANPVGATREVLGLSGMMQERSRTFQRDVADALQQAKGLGGVKGKVLATLFWPIAKMQMFVDVVTWRAAYSRAVKEEKADPVAFADNAVIGSQSSSLMSELSPIERGTLSRETRLSEVVKVWTTFYSYFNTKLNLAMRRTQATDFRKPWQVAELIADYAMLFWIEAAVGDLIRTTLPDVLGGDDGDDEEKTFWQQVLHQLGLTVHNTMGTLPGLREMSAVAQGFDPGPGATRGLGDVAKASVQVGKFGYALVDEDKEANWWQAIRAIVSAGNVVSPIKYPASQINVAIRAAEKADKGEDVTWIDFLMAKPKK